MDKKEDLYIIDTHAHYDDEAFEEDRDELLKSFEAKGIKRFVNIGASMESSRNSIALAKEYPFDYYYDEPDKEIQKKCFRAQLDLAKRCDLPVVIHSRDAAKDTLDILKEFEGVKGVIHCYSYSKEMAKEFIKLGYVLGIGGVVTFKNAKKLEETVEEISFEDFVLETDCPYLSPVPNRGKRNSSLNLTYIIDKLSEIKGVSKDFIIEKSFENAKRLYPKMK